MTTIVNNFSRTVVFQDTNENSIEVCLVKNGFAYVNIQSKVIVSSSGVEEVIIPNIDRMASFISGCFEENSNFKEKLFEAFNIDPSEEFQGFVLGDGENTPKIIKENSDVLGVVETLYNLRREYEQYLRVSAEKMLNEQNQKVNEILEKAKSVMFEPKNGYTVLDVSNAIESSKVDKNIIIFANLLAQYSQYFIQKEKLEIFEAFDKAYEDITEYACQIDSPESFEQSIKWLKEYWKYGKEIEEWYINKITKGFADML